MSEFEFHITVPTWVVWAFVAYCVMSIGLNVTTIYLKHALYKQGKKSQRLGVARVNEYEEPVVTLRDQFAMAALQGILCYSGRAEPEYIDALLAYNYADAMLKAREARERGESSDE